MIREGPFRVRCRLSEHRIPDHEPRDLRADRLDDSREVPTENGGQGERDEGVDISLHCIALERIDASRSAEHTSALQYLMRTSYAVSCLTTQHNTQPSSTTPTHTHNTLPHPFTITHLPLA